jgi:hypothetical protein
MVMKLSGPLIRIFISVDHGVILSQSKIYWPDEGDDDPLSLGCTQNQAGVDTQLSCGYHSTTFSDPSYFLISLG